MKRILTITAILMASGSFAQQDAMFTQYLDNQIYVNPAFTGAKEYAEITGIHREQWVGFTGSPRSTTLAIHSPLNYQSIGLGLDLQNDNIGPINRFNASANFAYRFQFKNKGKLSLGIKAGIDALNSKFNEIDHSEKDELAQEISGSIAPNFGVGAYYFAPKWFVGASIPRLTSKLSTNIQGINNERHVFVIAGALFKLNDSWELRPSSQLRMTAGAPINGGITATGIWNKKLWIGLNYRILESLGAFVQVKVTSQFKVGYAYDFPLSKIIRSVSSGSHEIMLSYQLNLEKTGYISPRYF